MVELESALASRLIDSKIAYDSLYQAILMAKESNLSDYIVEELTTQRKQVKVEYLDCSDKILGRMVDKRSTILGDNIIKIGNYWYGILCVNANGKYSIRFVTLLEKDIYIVQKTFKEKDLTTLELNAIEPAIIDEGALELYNLNVLERARNILSTYCDVNSLSTTSDYRTTICVSDHATKRWVQRKVGIKDEVKAEEYKKNNMLQLQASILQSFTSAEKIWVDEENYSYYFDDDNIVYIVGHNVIVTLYEEDYGFAKHINRMIVLSQIEVLKETHSSWRKQEQEYQESMKTLAKGVADYDEQINRAEQVLQQLKEGKALAIANGDKAKEDLVHTRELYEAEFVKLFRIEGVRNK